MLIGRPPAGPGAAPGGAPAAPPAQQSGGGGGGGIPINVHVQSPQMPYIQAPMAPQLPYVPQPNVQLPGGGYVQGPHIPQPQIQQPRIPQIPQPTIPQATITAKGPSNSTLLYIIIGLACLLLGVALAVLLKR
ncbi:MAG: hypothetical protein LAQ69_10495 [Acidobacteriia bacterium]|nr:hypothetical protein [Terriglobia bacterium]